MIVVLYAVVAVIGAGIAAVADFDIGSLLTPLLALHFGIKLAVAMVAFAFSKVGGGLILALGLFVVYQGVAGPR